MNILITLLFGAIAGWLAGFFVIGTVVLILVWRLVKKLLK